MWHGIMEQKFNSILEQICWITYLGTKEIAENIPYFSVIKHGKMAHL
jgi:hypothetical protein